MDPTSLKKGNQKTYLQVKQGQDQREKKFQAEKSNVEHTCEGQPGGIGGRFSGSICSARILQPGIQT